MNSWALSRLNDGVILLTGPLSNRSQAKWVKFLWHCCLHFLASLVSNRDVEDFFSWLWVLTREKKCWASEVILSEGIFCNWACLRSFFAILFFLSTSFSDVLWSGRFFWLGHFVMDFVPHLDARYRSIYPLLELYSYLGLRKPTKTAGTKVVSK